jgi:integrase
VKHQRSIRIDGKLVKSPKFDRASDANNWYNEKRREKQHVKAGVALPLNDHTTLNQYFDHTWLPRRQKKYTKATWGCDEQRYRDYVRKVLGNLRIAKVNSVQIKSCLKQVTDKHELSITTRDRVRALLSMFFGDAMNEEKPLRTDNPALNIAFSDPRDGKQKPRHIARKKDVIKFLNTARRLSALHFAVCSTFIMAGPRKQELIAFLWGSFDPDENLLVVKSKFVQAEGKIFDGTKAGSKEERELYIPDALTKILSDWREVTPFSSDDDFIFADADGNHMGPKEIWALVVEVGEAAGINAPPHALRHTMGRMFAANGGSTKALQTMLGHSNSQTTEIYSQLAAEQVKKDRNLVSFDLGDGDDD